MPSNFEFTNQWFAEAAEAVWGRLLPRINPTRILEVGSYEGASACYLIRHQGARQAIEMHCVDTWEGGAEHHADGTDMSSVEQRFVNNTQLACSQAAHPVQLVVHKRASDLAFASLLAGGKQGYFDFVYIDGLHQSPDVLCDAVLGFRLLRKGGVMAFDDYLWQEGLPGGTDPIRCPKLAIDAFVNIHCRQLKVIQAPLKQLFIQKLGD